MSEYLLAYCLCDVPGREICADIGLEVRLTPIYVGEYNIRHEFLRWYDYPIADSSDSEH